MALNSGSAGFYYLRGTGNTVTQGAAIADTAAVGELVGFDLRCGRVEWWRAAGWKNFASHIDAPPRARLRLCQRVQNRNDVGRKRIPDCAPVNSVARVDGGAVVRCGVAREVVACVEARHGRPPSTESRRVHRLPHAISC